ncbi:MAG TPA: hypothetical protein VNR36_00380 [Pseudolysinimonas sp.]|nr:hypothetical protein [Pseudolysinimonas sp.]
MVALPPALDGSALPLAERMAATLDGELYPLGGAHCPIDEVETPRLRLAAALAGLPVRLIAELGTAAWVWGATPIAPRPLELCVDLGARARPLHAAPVVIREVVVRSGDLVSLGERRVTSPLRTAIDLARSRIRWGDHEALLVSELARQTGFTFDDCRTVVEARRNLPDKRRAMIRLERALSPR